MTVFVKRAVKVLIREYGIPITWQSTTSVTRDPFTGIQKTNTQDYPIRKALVLPEIVTRKFSYDLSYIAAGKNFTYGGSYDEGILPIAVLTTHLPRDYGNEDHVIVDGSQYKITNYEKNPHGVVGFNLLRVVGQDSDEL